MLTEGRRARPGAGSVRDRILEGASEAFGANGYAATRVEDVLRAAGVSRPTFYKSFDSKDDVFEALSERHHRVIMERLAGASVACDEPFERLERSTEVFFRWRIELGPVGRVLDAEARSPGPRLAQHRRVVVEALIEAVSASFVQAGQCAPERELLLALIAGVERLADLLVENAPVTEERLQHHLGLVRRMYAVLHAS